MFNPAMGPSFGLGGPPQQMPQQQFMPGQSVFPQPNMAPPNTLLPPPGGLPPGASPVPFPQPGMPQPHPGAGNVPLRPFGPQQLLQEDMRNWFPPLGSPANGGNTPLAFRPQMNPGFGFGGAQGRPPQTPMGPKFGFGGY